MTLSMPTSVQDPATQQCLDRIAEQFPVQPQNVASSLKGTNVEGVEKLRTIRGTINSATSGTILQGAGFTISRIGTGEVKITFSTPFAAVPTVVTGHQTFTHNSNSTEPTVLAVTVGLSASGAAVDGVFYFIATGPR